MSRKHCEVGGGALAVAASVVTLTLAQIQGGFDGFWGPRYVFAGDLPVAEKPPEASLNRGA